MIGFFEFYLNEAKQVESEDAPSGTNFHLGRAYETGTAMWLHNNTAAKNNPAQAERMAMAKQLHNESMAVLKQKLPPEKFAEVKKRAQDSGRAYLESLKREEGINPEDIKEVHHTYAGIDHLVGRKVGQQQNPHDIMIKTKGGRLHGASLKFNPGTLTNNTMNTFDQMMSRNGFQTNAKKIWDAKKKRMGIDKFTGKELKAVRDKPSIVKANNEAQNEAGDDHAQAFNRGTPEQKRAFMLDAMKSNPAVPYHYVVGAKGGSSEAILNKTPYKLAHGAEDFHAFHTGNGIVHITDHEGRSIMMFEHRPTHGSFNSIQVNGKLGNGKIPGPVMQRMMDVQAQQQAAAKGKKKK